MMKLLTLSSLIFFSVCCFAQQDTTLVYKSSMYIKDPVRSKWRPVVQRNGDLVKVSFFDRKNILQEVIHFEDENLEIRKGLYQWYNTRGLGLLQEGDYDKGHKNGKWKSYNAVTNKLTDYTHYNYGKQDGEFKEFWDFESNKIKREGTYRNNKKVGNWKMFYQTGEPAADEVYNNNGLKIESAYFHKNGSPAKLEDIESMPKYAGGLAELYAFLGREIKYPKNAQRNGIEGIVYLKFVVKKDGRVDDITVTKSPDSELSEEAIRALRLTYNWTPGKQLGEYVNVMYSLPIKFSL